MVCKKLKNNQILHNYVQKLQRGLLTQRGLPVAKLQNTNKNFIEVGKEHVGFKTPKRAHWMSDDVWKLSLKRRDIKTNQNSDISLTVKTSPTK